MTVIVIRGHALSPSGDRYQRDARESGMTFLEVLIAIFLFAVFSSVFLVVTEMLGVLMPTSQSMSGFDDGCRGATTEIACINSAFDYIANTLDKSPSVEEKCYGRPENIAEMRFAPADGKSPPPWPDAYEICIRAYPGLRESSENPLLPGLYLLQAQKADKSDAAFWRVPIQRLFCRPYNLCLRP